MTPPRFKPVAAVLSTFGAVIAPIQAFFRLEAASGILLFAAAVVALAWANAGPASYEAITKAPLLAWAAVSLRDVINDGLMSLFFFVVGMEIKRELVAGELSTFRRALMPAFAAVGGMLVPALIFLAFNFGRDSQRGWGIPMATDIAFAIGCLALLGKRVPQALSVFLLALAIFDDIGGIVVIALFYGHGLAGGWLLAALAITGILWLLNRANVAHGLAYTIGGVALWYALFRGGIHATISGVVLGLMIPARVSQASLPAPLDRFIRALHPWVAFLMMPAFALANSGVQVTGVGDPVGPVALGVGLGLLLGKPIGILGATALAVKLGWGDRPGGASYFALTGISIVAGIGFTVALFIAALAYPAAPALLGQAKLGILAGSALSGSIGMLVLRLATARPREATT